MEKFIVKFFLINSLTTLFYLCFEHFQNNFNDFSIYHSFFFLKGLQCQ